MFILVKELEKIANVKNILHSVILVTNFTKLNLVFIYTHRSKPKCVWTALHTAWKNSTHSTKTLFSVKLVEIPVRVRYLTPTFHAFLC